MASPQVENGYTRTANELSEAIMQSDFSKRQRNILDFIIRMSYGCGKKSALLKYSDFELVGVYKGDIKKELEYLQSAHVIAMEIDEMLHIGLNKDYDQWRIDIIRTFSKDKWEQVLRRNLNNKVSEILTGVSETPTIPNTGVSEILIEQKCSVSKILTEQTYQPNTNADSQPPKEKDLKEIIEESRSNTPLPPNNSELDVKEVLDEYSRQFKTHLGATPVIKDSRDGPKIQELLNVYPKELVKQITKQYFLDKDEFVKIRGYPIALMVSQVNQYVAKIQTENAEVAEINPDDYPGGPECKCEGTGYLNRFDPEANGGQGKHIAVPCPCQKLKFKRLHLAEGG